MDILSQTYHQTLANYFQNKPLYLDGANEINPNIRKLAEQPWQQTKGKTWEELEETLCSVDFMQAKISANLFADLFNDYSNTDQYLKSSILKNETKTLLNRCKTVGRLLSNIQEQIKTDLNSIGAQLILELQEINDPVSEYLTIKIANQLDNKIWIWRSAVNRGFSSNHLAQIGLKQNYLHSLNFSPDSNTLFYFDTDGKITRWDWSVANTSYTTPPAEGIYRYATIVSPSCILVMNMYELWAFETSDIWKDNLSFGNWRKVYGTIDGKLDALTSSSAGGYIMLAEARSDGDRILFFDNNSLELLRRIRTPYIEKKSFVNYLAANQDGSLQAICYGDGSIAISNGFFCKFHYGGVFECIFLDNPENDFASCGADGYLLLWNTKKGLMKKINLSYGDADCMAYNSTYHLFATGHRTGVISIIFFDNGKVNYHNFWPGVSGWILSLRFSPCGNFLAVGGKNGILRLFSIETVMMKQNNALFKNIPRGPIEKGFIHNFSLGNFFLDFEAHLYGSGDKIDSHYLPQVCHSFCTGPKSGIIVIAMQDNIRIIDPISGKPEHIHKLPESLRLTMCLSSDEQKLAILEPEKIVLYEVSDWKKPPKEIWSIPLNDLLTIMKMDYKAIRRRQPVMFCRNDELLLLSIEPSLYAEMDKDRIFTVPKLGNHIICFIKTSTGELSHFKLYDGFCTSLAELPGTGEIAVGLGTANVFIKEDDEASQLPIEKTGVLFLSLVNSSVERWYPLSREDMGVSCLSSALQGRLLCIGSSSGRLRLISTVDLRELASVSLTASIIYCQFKTPQLLECLDNGHSNGLWPAKHEFVCNFHIKK